MSMIPARTIATLLTSALALGGLAPPPSSRAAGGDAPRPSAAIHPVADCAALAGTDLTAIGGAGSRVTSAALATSRGVAVCRVDGTLAPAVGFRVELPVSTWTGRYMQTGCGGLCGNVSINVGVADGCPTVTAGGFVTASTDMGHTGNDGAFGREAQPRADFAYRGVHVTGLAARALIRAYYGRDARWRYFDGCSDGGREALMEAQRYPTDFNGIIAGAAAMNFQVQNSLFHGWMAASNTGADGKPILLAPRLPILHRAVVAACDGDDGVRDGLVSAPALCRFDPATVRCREGRDAAQCLTPAEVAVVRRFYDGPRDPQSGERLTAGQPQFGSELAWGGVYVPASADAPVFSRIIVEGAMGGLIFSDGQPSRLADLRFTRATFDRLRARHPLFDATNPDLSAFQRAGGKLIIFHGWADPHISPLNSIRYHEALRQVMGAARADGFERLYLVPGMNHCSGGEGPNQLDLVTPLMAWVEAGRAPDAVIARQAKDVATSAYGQPTGAGGADGGAARGPEKTQGRPAGMMREAPYTGPDRSRPVYPYPFISAYGGKGDVNDASSWKRGRQVVTPLFHWAGDGFFRPFEPLLD